MKQSRAMIQQSPGCDDPDQSMFQGNGSPGTVDGQRGPWSIRREPERKRGGGEREGGESGGGGGESIESVESDTACSLLEQKQKQRLEKCNIDQNKQIVSCRQHSVTLVL